MCHGSLVVEYVDNLCDRYGVGFSSSRIPDYKPILGHFVQSLLHARLGKSIEALRENSQFDASWSALASRYCQPRAPTCDPLAPYRTMDGTCNNLLHPVWGMANRGQARYLPPAYADGKFFC